MTLNDPVQQIVLNFLNHFAYQDAIFLSERLHSEYKTEDSLYLLALSYYRSGQKSLRVYHILKERQLRLAKSRFLLAKCCLDLSKYGEAESVLTSNLSLKPDASSSGAKFKLYDEIVKEYGSEYSPHVLQILANVYSKTDRSSQAVEFYKKSLRLNPFMWSSFDSVCTMGEKIDPAKYFTFNSALNAYKSHILETNSQIQHTLNNVTNQLNVNNNVQQNQSQNQFANVLKQQNDLQYLDQKCKHDISTILRLVEQDQQTKFLNSFNNSSTFKENALSNQTEEQTSSTNQPTQATSSSQTQAACSCPETKLNQSLNQSVSGASQSSSSGMTLSTPITQPNVSNTLTLAPPQKKCVVKRIPSHKPLFGQNTTNSLSSSNSAQTSGTQKPLKSKSKSSSDQPMDESSVDSREAETMEQQSDKPVKVKSSKKLKLKSKKNKSEDMEPVADAEGNNAASDSAEPVQYECKHCNLLSNQTKNWHLNANPFSSRKTKLNILFEQSVCLDNMMKLLKDMGIAVYNLKQFECDQAIDCFERLPDCQLNSSFVLGQMAKAHFELHNYSKAEKLYTKLRREYPYHLDGLEYYSTTLWHLQKEIALSSLAQELTEFDKLAPETWCVVGNCFSLHKEHDAAIKFFHRAAQVDPKFTYAYNLLGHEYVLIEEMDKGLSSFRKAIFLEPRHYNAWYGISMIHFKQEKFLLSEKYLKKALLINPHSSTLMVHIAVVYHSLKQSDKALQILDRALAIEPKNTLCKFHRASILFSMEEYEKALEEYEKLRRLIPKESLIYYMISKTHKKLKNVHLSLMYMSWAMDLDPKGVNNQLKESIDKRYVIDSDSTFARELETINTSTLDAIYGGTEILQTNDDDEEEEEQAENMNSQARANEPIDQSNNDENNNTNNVTHDNESDDDDLMDNEEGRDEPHADFSLRQKFQPHDQQESDEDDDDEDDENEEEPDDEQQTDSSDNNEHNEEDDDDEAASALKPGPSHSQASSKHAEPKQSHDAAMDAADDDTDDPATVVSNSEKSRAKKSKRIEFQQRSQDDSDHDADDRLEHKANTSASFVLVNEFKSSTYTPESSVLPVIEQLTAAPKSKKKLTKMPANMFEAFGFKKSLHMGHERGAAADDAEDDDQVNDQVNESDLMSTTIDTTKNDTIPFLNQSQMSVNKSMQSAAQLTLNSNKHLSFSQSSAPAALIHDQLMDSVDEDL